MYIYIFYYCIPGAIFIKHLREKLKLRELFATKLQHNQKTLQIFGIEVGCRFNSVYINCFPIIKKREFNEISF